MRTAEHDRRPTHDERDELATTPSPSAPAANAFHAGGALPPVGGEFQIAPPSPSDRAFGPKLPPELLERVARATETELVSMMEAHPSLQGPILTAIGQVHGAHVMHVVSKSTPKNVPSSEEGTKAKKKLPDGYDDGPIQVAEDHATDKQKVAGFNQVALYTQHESAAPSHVRLPPELVRSLDEMWSESQKFDQEQGGNLVRTYGGDWEVRRTHTDGDDAGSYSPDTSNVGRWARHAAIIHTHPLDKTTPDPVSFSPADLTTLTGEDQPLNILRSGNQIYMIVRTKEFEALLPKDNDEGKISDLTIAMQDTWTAAYRAEHDNGGGHPSAVEKGVIAVCRKFHLLYYWGQGQDLHRVR